MSDTIATNLSPEQALEDVTVLDLSDGIAGQFCTRLLADLGAQVTLVEPNDGSATRRAGPELGPRSDTSGESALYWHLNTGKSSVTWDRDNPRGLSPLQDLVANSDLVVCDSAAANALASQLSLGDSQILVSIDEFGPQGPYAKWHGDAMIFEALSGLMFCTGSGQREPLYGAGERSYYAAGAAAATAALNALHAKRRTGIGQRVGVNVHEVAVAMSQCLIAQYSYNRTFPTRARYSGACDLFQCEDGWLVLFVSPGRWDTLCASIQRLDPGLAGIELPTFRDYADLIANWDRAGIFLQNIFTHLCCADVVAAAQSTGNIADVVMDLSDVRECPHLAARDYWEQTSTASGAVQLSLGPAFRLSSTPRPKGLRAPRPNEPRDSVSERTRRSISIPSSPHEATSHTPALEGLHVLELTTAWAGPFAGEILGAFGADVIKIESPTRMDNWRGPAGGGDVTRYPDQLHGLDPWNRNAWFNSQNARKRSLSIDLKQSAAQPIREALTLWADVILCNFSGGVLERLGLGLDDARLLNPDIIVVEMPAMGEGGPKAAYLGVGPTVEASAGILATQGYSDGNPVRTGPAYADPVGGFLSVIATLGALHARERIGGQRIEVAQREGLMQWIGEYLLSTATGGPEPTRNGNDNTGSAPHDSYPCSGDDEWVAVAVRNDAQWTALCDLVGGQMASLGGYTLAQRHVALNTVNDLLREWCSIRTKFDVADTLQAAGVPAAPVLSGRDLYDEPQLHAAGFYIDASHPAAGKQRYQGLPFHFSASPLAAYTPSPCLGEHSIDILEQLGVPADSIKSLIDEGVVTVYGTTIDTDMQVRVSS